MDQDAINYIMDLYKVSFPEAVQILAKLSEMDIPDHALPVELDPKTIGTYH